MTKPRVAILHYSCPPVIGGVEFVMEAHARLLADTGFSVRLIVGKGGEVHPKVRTVVIPEIATGGGPVRRVLAALAEGRVSSGFEAAVARVEQKLRVALRPVDVCMIHNVLTMHFNLVMTAALANIMKRQRRIHFVGWTHDAMFVDPGYSQHHRDVYPWTLLKQSLPGCDYCVISGQRKREVAGLFGVPEDELPVIPDGVDMAELLGLTAPVADLYREEHLSVMDLVALTPTRIVRRKNLEQGLEIVAAFKRRGRQVRWFVTGAPDLYSADAVEYFTALTKLRRKLGIEKEVVFLCERFGERVSSEDLRGLYALANVLLFPSTQEGFGIPVVEAGIAGLLTVTSDIPALRELGLDESVYVHSGEDSDLVAGRILRAFEKSPRLVFQRRLISQYSWQAVFTSKILSLLMRPEAVWPR
ncbi:glycosyltransferase family 4 protein [Verrucomicrobiota bacterium]